MWTYFFYVKYRAYISIQTPTVGLDERYVLCIAINFSINIYICIRRYVVIWGAFNIQFRLTVCVAKTEHKNLASSAAWPPLCASYVTASGIHIWLSVFPTGKLVYGIKSFETNFAPLNHLPRFDFSPFPRSKNSLRGAFQSIGKLKIALSI
jgi:hypothetical protein